jgi:hypothetical protein
MKLNYVGIVGAILAFVSIALPWWTASAGGSSYDLKLYDQGTFSTLNFWYGWVALVFVLLGGLLGLAGSVMSNGKKIVMGGGILALIAIIVFPVGFQTDLMRLGAPFNIFSSGDYSTYLSYGFWLALVAAIIMLVAMRYSKPIAQAPSPSPSPPPPTTAT